MFGSDITHSVVISLNYDPAADDDVALWRAPRACEVVGAYAILTNAVGADTANYFDLALYNGGAAGTGLTAMAGTIGGTGGWTVGTPTPFTISEGTLAAGDTVLLRYNETGTGTFTAMQIQLDYKLGVAAA